MNTISFRNLFLFLVLLPFLASAYVNPDWKGAHTKVKTIKKEFTVNSNALLQVDNSYGNISVMTYSGDKIRIEVVIKTNSNNEAKAKEKLDEITVDFTNGPNTVTAKTIFNKNNSRSWWKSWRSSNVSMEINYIINLPITNSVNIKNDYGSINLEKLEGRAILKCDYGKITTKELMADNNSISFDYTHNSYFEYIKSGDINADYSDYTVSKAKHLNINADYTKSVVKFAEDINYSCDYGSLTAENVNNLKGDGDYLTLVIGNVYKNLDIESDYGSIKIEKMAANAGNVNIDSDYTGITIGYDPSYSFRFELDLSYANLRESDGFEFTKKKIESTKKYYSGHYGNPSTANLIKVDSEYGSITFKKK
ncbi:MAG TPA: hypothetical protein PKL92_02890 [Aquaticitalea sp.]|nr:hypothetical protein [Aquaticitalea sp.]